MAVSRKTLIYLALPALLLGGFLWFDHRELEADWHDARALGEEVAAGGAVARIEAAREAFSAAARSFDTCPKDRAISGQPVLQTGAPGNWPWSFAHSPDGRRAHMITLDQPSFIWSEKECPAPTGQAALGMCFFDTFGFLREVAGDGFATREAFLKATADRGDVTRGRWLRDVRERVAAAQDPEFLVAAEIVEYVEPQILGPSSFESGAVVVSKYLFDVENGTCSQWTEAVVNADQITTITLAGRARGGGGFGVSTLAHNLRSRVMRLLTGSYAQ